MRKQHLQQLTLIKDQERSGRVTNRRGLEVSTNYRKIQISERLTSRFLQLGLNIYMSLCYMMKGRKGGRGE